MSAFPDHFSSVARDYSAFRPEYPPALFEWLSQLVGNLAGNTGLVWDCGAGTGQASTALGDNFPRVIATDASARQIVRAPKHDHVLYVACTAEHCPLPPRSVALITVAQALHWFNVAAFYNEVRRVAVPNALIAVWSYGLLRVDGSAAVEQAVDCFSEATVGPWWPPERRHVNVGYSDLPFPFERVAAPVFDMTAKWTRSQLVGYLRTWSSVSRKRAATGADPVAEFEPELAEHWGEHESMTLRWPLTLLVGRIGR